MRIHFTFDDSNSSDIWCAQRLHERGLVGIFFLCDTGDLDTKVPELLRLGQIVGNHTPRHTRLEGDVDALIQHEIVPFNQKLMALGARGDYFAYPQSAGAYRIPFLHGVFKYIYRGHDEDEADHDGEISRVSVFDWQEQRIKPMWKIQNYKNPLQLHAIGTGGLYDLTTQQFLELCNIEATR